MVVRLHEGPLDGFLAAEYDSLGAVTPETSPPGVCVVGSGIVRRNLRERLSADGVAAKNLATYETIEDIAQTLLQAHHGETPTILESRFVLRLLEAELRAAEAGDAPDALVAFAQSVPWTEESVLESVQQELDEYFRCTDAGADHDALDAVVADLEDPFARENGCERLAAFAALHDALADRIAGLGEIVYLSRSHLVKAARAHVADYWQECYGDRDWLAFATVSVLDNPTLRFLLAIGEDADVALHFFFERGTRDHFRRRFESLAVDTTVVEDSGGLDSDGASRLLDAAAGDAPDGGAIHEAVSFVEAPERRREVEFLVDDIRRRLDAGADPEDLLVIARDAGTYQSVVEDVFETNQIPYHVETRRPIAHATAYRFLKATFDLLERIEAGEPVAHWELVDPIRLGFCPPDTRSEYWPVSDHAFLYLEEYLHDEAIRAADVDSDDDEDPALPFADWLETVSDADGWEYPLGLCEGFLEWVQEAASTPPSDGEALAGTIQRLELSHIYHTIPRHQASPHGPGVDTTRTNLTREHSTKLAQRVMSQASTVGWYYDNVQDVLDATPTWREATTALGQVVGTASYGRANNDANTVRVVDTGNAHFLEADHVYVLGMAADQFPTEFSTPAFLPNRLREAVHQAAVDGDQPFLYLESRNDQYEQEVDLYEAALRACADTPTMIRPYKDAEGRDVEWSPFLDRVLATADDDAVHRVGMDEWLPQRHDGDSWEATWERLCMKDRLRSVVFYTQQPGSSFSDDITPATVHALASAVDPAALNEGVDPRLTRYLESPRQIEVQPDEPAFDGDITVDDVVGEPVRPHELDLFAQCELKYYFYQFLFNVDGDAVQRDWLPVYSSRRPHYRFGELPEIIRHNYTSGYHDQKRQTVIEDLLPDRQADLGAFESAEALADWFGDQDAFTDYDTRTILHNLEAERRLVAQEQANGIEREWTWADAEPIEYGDFAVKLPARRVDVLPEDDDYEIPVYPVRHTTYAEKALKQCWEGENQLEDDRWYRHEECTHLCESCSNYDDCSYPTKHALDHRLHVTAHGVDDLAGVVYQERFSDSAAGRRGFVKEGHADAVRGGLAEDPERNLEEWGNRQWWGRRGSWGDDLSAHLAALQPDPDVTFEADMEFVHDGGCESCVYRELCHVPIQEARQ